MLEEIRIRLKLFSYTIVVISIEESKNAFQFINFCFCVDHWCDAITSGGFKFSRQGKNSF